MHFHFTVHVNLTAEGLERAIRDAGNAIATAIDNLVPPPPPPVQITAGRLILDQQHDRGDFIMATSILNDRPQHITAVWTGVDASGNTVPVVPDSVDYSLSDASLGTLTPDATNPTGGAVFMPNAGALGDITFGAVSHQSGLADFTATPVTGTLVNPPAAVIQISGGALSLDPQLPTARVVRGAKK